MNAGATANEQTVVITRQRGPARVPVEPRLVRPQKQRIALHRPVLKSAIITFNQRVSSAPCLVRDLSSTGARLRVEGTIHVPNSFDVIIDLDAGLVRTIAQGMLADHDMAQAQDQPNASRRLLSTRQARPDRGRTYAQPLQQLTPSSALAKTMLDRDRTIIPAPVTEALTHLFCWDTPTARWAAPRAGIARRPQPALASLAASLQRFCAGRVLRCPRESASVVASARSCWRWCSSSKSREFAACSHFLSAAARVGGRSVRSEPLRVGIGTARSFEVECALNAKGPTIRLFAKSGKGHHVRRTLGHQTSSPS